MTTVVQILGSLGKNRGGLTRIVYERLKLIPSDYNIIIANTVHVANEHKKVFDELVSEGEIPKSTKYREFYREKINPDLTSNDSMFRNADIDKHYPKNLGLYQLKEVKDNIETLYSYDSRGVLISIDKINKKEQCFITREFFVYPFVQTDKLYYRKNNTPYLLERKNNSVNRIKRYFYDITGHLVFSCTYDVETKQQTEFLNNVNGTIVRSNKNIVAYLWLENLLNNIDDDCVQVFFDENPAVELANRIDKSQNKSKLEFYFTLHNNFYNEETGLSAPYLVNLNCFDYLITPTQLGKKYLCQLLPNREREVIYIPNLCRFDDCGYIERNTKNKMRILYISRIDKGKYPLEVIRVFYELVCMRKLNKDYILDFVGIGSLLEECKLLVNELNISDKVVFHGYVKDPTDIYKNADLLLFTSTGEGFGLTLIEAMQHSLPVISSNVLLGPRDIVIDGRNGFFIKDLRNYREVARQIHKLLSNEELYQSLCLGAYETYQMNYKDGFKWKYLKIFGQNG